MCRWDWGSILFSFILYAFRVYRIVLSVKGCPRFFNPSGAIRLWKMAVSVLDWIGKSTILASPLQVGTCGFGSMI